MISRRSRKILFVCALISSYVVIFPVSYVIIDSLWFTQPFNPIWQCGILLVWPDHVEVRSLQKISEVSPRPPNAGYTFNVPPDRQARIENQVRHAPTGDPEGAWSIRIKQLGADRQQIQLERWRDGFTGLIYEARPDRIIPLQSRHAGVLGATIVFYLDLFLWGTLWLAGRLLWRMVKHRRAHIGPLSHHLT
jgi:hypothetical protein